MLYSIILLKGYSVKVAGWTRVPCQVGLILLEPFQVCEKWTKHETDISDCYWKYRIAWQPVGQLKIILKILTIT